MVKNSPAMRVDLGSIPGLGRYPGEGKSYPFQYSDLENSIKESDSTLTFTFRRKPSTLKGTKQ